MEGTRTKRNRLTREQCIRVVLWIERNKETLKMHQATLAKAAEMANEALPMQRRDAPGEYIEVTPATLKKLLIADKSLDWRVSEAITTERACVIIARNLISVMAFTDRQPCLDLVRMAGEEVVFVPVSNYNGNGQGSLFSESNEAIERQLK